MVSNNRRKAFVGGIIFLFIFMIVPAQGTSLIQNASMFELPFSTSMSPDELTLDFHFDQIDIETYEQTVVARVPGTNFNKMTPGQPVIPSYIKTVTFPFGTTILEVQRSVSTPEIIPVEGLLAWGTPGSIDMNPHERSYDYDSAVYHIDAFYPTDWISYHLGGGLEYGEHVTFFILRVYPARYNPVEHHVQFSRNISVTIQYNMPDEPILSDPDVYDFLIITPDQFLADIQPLEEHKQSHGVKTIITTLEYIEYQMEGKGRDQQENIKYFIKKSIEEWGISDVLLVGGLQGQSSTWNFPVRYSRVIPPTEQEYPEQSFLSDLYYADIYDAAGDFSSWDSNDDDVFSLWNEEFKEIMDLYPDVYLGRIPCRNTNELKVMVEKIITYEQEPADDAWFKNLVLVAGDSYPDVIGFNEGELIAEEAITLMPGFNPLKVYASIDDINQKTVNKAMNQGSGFAYFCGHGSPATWSTHFPPDGSEWTTGYNLKDMVPLRNGHKLPITIVGGCHNGQFDTGLHTILRDIKQYGIQGYLLEQPYRFFYSEWAMNCWAWWLSSKANGGAIATIANTGLGTHGDGDADYNQIADYLEVLDGWLELRFLQLYGEEGRSHLGENHGQCMTEYLHRFLGDEEKMDTKMAQQWQLFGDPSLKIAGYE